MAAIPAIYLDQSSIFGSSDTLKVSRLPVLNAGGTIRYYDVQFKLQVDAAGAPVLAPLNSVITLSTTLTVGAFKAGNYKDGQGYVYSVTGPGAAPAGRTTWNILLTKKCATSACTNDSLSGSWTTGPISGHPIEPILKAQTITTNTYSWGVVIEGGIFQNYFAAETL